MMKNSAKTMKSTHALLPCCFSADPTRPPYALFGLVLRVTRMGELHLAWLSCLLQPTSDGGNCAKWRQKLSIISLVLGDISHITTKTAKPFALFTVHTATAARQTRACRMSLDRSELPCCLAWPTSHSENNMLNITSEAVHHQHAWRCTCFLALLKDTVVKPSRTNYTKNIQISGH